eukprot:TRINITY_DN18819_c1_g1_i1.p1 TRINITY_DN18819_c1_g1~~TRINITY_DN18819_c1_g1_i1.p1  ORF type:complete len:319 (-),score=65.27 TRINITY_DN18819_c1_g1_i1:323-1279(-)
MSSVDYASPLGAVSLFLSQHHVSGTLIFSMITGSQSYNLDTSSSDTDYIGIYQALSTSVLSLSDPLPSISTLATGAKPDVTVYEIAYFANLLINGNPFVLEMLFSDKHELIYQKQVPITRSSLESLYTRYGVKRPTSFTLSSAPSSSSSLSSSSSSSSSCSLSSPSSNNIITFDVDIDVDVAIDIGFEWLRARRMQFITRRSVSEYLAYIAKRLKEHSKRPMPGKRIYHCVRLLFDLKRMIRGGAPVIYMPHTSHERQILLDIRAEKYTNEGIMLMIDEMTAEVERDRPWTSLPEAPDADLLETWLLNLRLVMLQQEG